MRLVDPEVADEFAVVAAWVSALVPWSVSLALGTLDGGSLVEIRFPLLLVRFLPGVQAPTDDPLVLLPWDAIAYYGRDPGAFPFQLWTVGTGLVVLALALSVAMYVLDDRLGDAPVDAARTMGALLLAAALLFTASALVLTFGSPLASLPATGFPGTVVPVGVLFQFVFAYALLTVDRDGQAVGASGTVD